MRFIESPSVRRYLAFADHTHLPIFINELLWVALGGSVLLRQGYTRARPAAANKNLSGMKLGKYAPPRIAISGAGAAFNLLSVYFLNCLLSTQVKSFRSFISRAP